MRIVNLTGAPVILDRPGRAPLVLAPEGHARIEQREWGVAVVGDHVARRVRFVVVGLPRRVRRSRAYLVTPGVAALVSQRRYDVYTVEGGRLVAYDTSAELAVQLEHGKGRRL